MTLFVGWPWTWLIPWTCALWIRALNKNTLILNSKFLKLHRNISAINYKLLWPFRWVLWFRIIPALYSNRISIPKFLESLLRRFKVIGGSLSCLNFSSHVALLTFLDNHMLSQNIDHVTWEISSEYFKPQWQTYQILL